MDGIAGNKYPQVLILTLIFFSFFNCRAEPQYQEEMKEMTMNLSWYIDSEGGNDNNNGKSPELAWKSLSKLDNIQLLPGARIHFKRGSVFTESLCIKDSGTKGKNIILTDYGDLNAPAPEFTNPVFDPENKKYGNCIRIKGSHIIVENLYFTNTTAELPENTGGFLTMWELGAIFIDKSAKYCIVRNNELYNCGVGIKSYGKHILITDNYIHDCNRVLKKWNWGPIGIWLGSDHQEVCYNRIINYSTVDPRINWGPDAYGGGADGGAIEIDDARNDKHNISIHHNYSRDCQGFLEVTWSDVEQKPDYRNFKIHHNVSDDYQQFIALWRGANCKIDNNTIIRRKRNVNDWGVFNITQYNSNNLIRNNIIITEKNIVIFNVGKNANAQPNSVIENNIYWAASHDLIIGMEGPGASSIIENPKLLNYSKRSSAKNFSLTNKSPAIDSGLDLGYENDFEGNKIPQGIAPDIGAFEFSKQ